MAPKMESVGYLMVKVLEAKGLADTDSIGKSDPFCVVELNNDRFITQTECNNLTPLWQKVFQFENIQDVCDVLEITVYDEDNDHKHDFLGRLKIPLLNIENNAKRWYLLKSKDLRSPAQGNQPQILLELFFTYNKIWASVKTIKCSREKIFYQSKKKKCKTSSYSIARIKATRSGDALSRLFALIDKKKQTVGGDSKIGEISVHIFLIFLVYFFEPWLIPFCMIILFAMSHTFPKKDRMNRGSPELMNDVDIETETEKADDAILGITWLTFIRDKMRQIQVLRFSNM